MDLAFVCCASALHSLEMRFGDKRVRAGLTIPTKQTTATTTDVRFGKEHVQECAMGRVAPACMVMMHEDEKN